MRLTSLYFKVSLNFQKATFKSFYLILSDFQHLGIAQTIVHTVIDRSEETSGRNYHRFNFFIFYWKSFELEKLKCKKTSFVKHFSFL